MEVDAATFFAAIDEARDPAPVMSREEAVILALLDNIRTPGICPGCGADITHKANQARWCDECHQLAWYIMHKASNRQRHNGTQRADNCADCGKRYPPRPGRGVRCVKCQTAWRRAEDARRWRAEDLFRNREDGKGARHYEG